MTRPYVLHSVATSLDGYIDDTSPDRLLLSNPADFARVDRVRAGVDAIMIGAGTLRADNPRLIVKDPALQADRLAAGKPAQPRKVTVTASGDLDPDAKFWHHGIEDYPPLVFTVTSAATALKERLGDLAEVVDLGPAIDFTALLDHLGGLGIERLMVEGGTHLHTALLSAGLVDELHLALGPVLVGDQGAPRFVSPAAFPGGSTRRFHLAGVEQIGDVALLTYRPKETSLP
ncbi:dihydrofolate reductase family protein [Nocardia puris]|uniref:RibD family protein n=1 Tax=Nocardia puris TaxID=208602 RepID=UPI001895A330|nr:dihydrofolate reductase family protein [Nocardia puris]MBF6215827.1 dihydrofolate reductase family protein [Nocardia puris]